MRYEESEVEFEDEVDLLMSSDIVSAQVSTKPISFTKVQSGWFFKEDRQELVGTYNANFYSINGMVLETRKRREHLSNDDLMKNKALLENFAKGNAQYLEQQQQTQNGENGEVSDRIQPNLSPSLRKIWKKSENGNFCLFLVLHWCLHYAWTSFTTGQWSGANVSIQVDIMGAVTWDPNYTPGGGFFGP